MKKYILLIISIFIITACNNTTTLISKKSSINSTQKSYIIENITVIDVTENNSNIDNKAIEDYANYFEQALDKALIKAKFKKDLIKSDTTIRYSLYMDEGNRALRYFVGFGAGQAKAIIKVYITNKSDNKDLAELDTEATLSIGIFGGDAKGILDNAAKDIVLKLLQSEIFQLDI